MPDGETKNDNSPWVWEELQNCQLTEDGSGGYQLNKQPLIPADSRISGGSGFKYYHVVIDDKKYFIKLQPASEANSTTAAEIEAVEAITAALKDPDKHEVSESLRGRLAIGHVVKSNVSESRSHLARARVVKSNVGESRGHLARGHVVKRGHTLTGIIMRHYEGDLLSDYLSHKKDPKTTAVKLDTALTTLKQVAKTLALFKQLGFHHRDIKLENLFRNLEGRIVLGDFGTATKVNKSAKPSGTRRFASRRLFDYIQTAKKKMPSEQIETEDIYTTTATIMGTYLMEWTFPAYNFPVDDQKKSLEALKELLNNQNIPTNIKTDILSILMKDHITSQEMTKEVFTSIVQTCCDNRNAAISPVDERYLGYLIDQMNQICPDVPDSCHACSIM